MSLIKKIKNKVLENYHSHRWYFFAKLSIIVLMLLVFIWSGLDVFSLIVDGAEMDGILSGLKKSLIIIFVRIILNWVIELIFSLLERLKIIRIICQMMFYEKKRWFSTIYKRK